jgi:signal transduction histidine kinase
VLAHMQSLSGAEFLVTNASGQVLSHSDQAPGKREEFFLREVEAPAETPGDDRFRREPQPPSRAAHAIEIDGATYWYRKISKISPSPSSNPVASLVHIFVPRKSDWAIWRETSQTPLMIAAIVLPLALLVSLAMAAQVTRPLAKLISQVGQIAEGKVYDIPPINSGDASDEVGDLNLSINAMANKLKDHDQQLRQNERLQTLLQLGNGLAHHLRNSATGCKMAIELLASEQPSESSSENIEVARRQLDLMESYLGRFLSIGKIGQQSGQSGLDQPAMEVDLVAVLEEVVFLLTPAAKHLGVQLETRVEGEGISIKMIPDDAKQLMINLIDNAIAAASQNAVAGLVETGKVAVELKRDDQRFSFSVTDNGVGPPESIAADLFQPFVTGKPEGTGLGLALVKEIVDRVGGSVRWRRFEGGTEFVVEFDVGFSGKGS